MSSLLILCSTILSHSNNLFLATLLQLIIIAKLLSQSCLLLYAIYCFRLAEMLWNRSHQYVFFLCSSCVNDTNLPQYWAIRNYEMARCIVIWWKSLRSSWKDIPAATVSGFGVSPDSHPTSLPHCSAAPLDVSGTMAMWVGSGRTRNHSDGKRRDIVERQTLLMETINLLSKKYAIEKRVDRQKLYCSSLRNLGQRHGKWTRPTKITRRRQMTLLRVGFLWKAACKMRELAHCTFWLLLV